MSKITLDPGLKSKLNGFQEPVQVCDEDGTVVGCFLPDKTYREYVYAWLKTQVSDEEIASLRQQTGGKTLAEIWQEFAVRSNRPDLVALVPVDMELLEDMLAREQVEELAAGIDWDRVVKAYPPSQEWFDREEPKPF